MLGLRLRSCGGSIGVKPTRCEVCCTSGLNVVLTITVLLFVHVSGLQVLLYYAAGDRGDLDQFSKNG